jgi:hypothetical protein
MALPLLRLTVAAELARSFMSRLCWPPHLRLSILVAAASLATASGGWAASKSAIAVIGDAAPGGGQFAGPGFTGFPAAAGDGWIAFRGEVIGGRTAEALIVAHMTAPTSRAQVASLGQTVPGATGSFASCAGTLREFVGPPVVNARGEVAFLALISPDEETPAEDEFAPVAAGIFLFSEGVLHPVACSLQDTPAGRLDLVAIVDPFVDPTSTIAERAPALNDVGDVAFLTGTVDADGIPADGVIFLAPRGGALTPVARISQPFAGGEIVNLGPPALNNHRALAFHGFATTTDPNDTDGIIDGIFTAAGGTMSVLVQDVGNLPPPLEMEPLFEFQDPVSLNDRGEVAFLAGAIFDLSGFGDDEEGPATLIHSGGITKLIAYPGQQLGPDRVTGVRLGSAGGSQLAAPAVTPTGEVVFFASLNSGAGEAFFIWDPTTELALPLVYTLGSGASATPAGGVYNGAGSAPAVDAVSGIVFRARIIGGATSEAIVYRPASGNGSPIVVGDAAPSVGFFAGHPFSTPLLNDAGDVVFRAFVARGPASVGIFRARAGTLQALVRAGDPSPNPGGERFTDLVGEPSVNASGAIAFAATVERLGRGIYMADASGTLRKIAVRDDPLAGAEPGTTFLTLAANPAINGLGQVAFRGTVLSVFDDRLEGIFLGDGTNTRALVYEKEPSPAGLPFFKFRDPVVTDLPSIAFRAPLGSFVEATNGLFLADAGGTTQIALEQEELGDGIRLSTFNGDPVVSASGELAFLASRTRPFEPGSILRVPLGPAIFRRTAAGLEAVAHQGMRGPAGGTFRSLGQPSINSLGHIAFRASFQPLSGGTSGIFLAGDDGLSPHVLLREVAPGGGRLGSFRPQLSINDSDDVGFTANVVQGTTRHSGIFVASKTSLTARRLAFRVRADPEQPRDRISMKLKLKLGSLTNGVAPADEPVIISLSDGTGTLWSATVGAGLLQPRGGGFVVVPRAGTPLRAFLRSLRLRVKKGSARVSAISAPLDLTFAGFRPLEPPFTVSLQVGDDSGTASVACTLGERGGRCARRAPR